MRTKVTIAGTALVFLLGTISVSANPWSVGNGFNNTNWWGYMQRVGAGCSGAATNLQYPFSGPPNTIGFQGVNTPVVVPLIAYNQGPTQTYTSAKLPANSVWMHPGETGVNDACASVRFKAPQAGTYRVEGTITSLDVAANSVNGYIFASNALAMGPLNLSGPTGTKANFNQIVTVAPSDLTIDFALDDGGNYFNDSTKLSMKITMCSTPSC